MHRAATRPTPASPLRLGLSEDGMIYALDFWDDAGGETLSICALLPGNGMLALTQLAGGSPFGLSAGETLYLTEPTDKEEPS